jgi:hypothetical protein
MTLKLDGNGEISGITGLSPYAQARDRNKLINSNFCINQLAKSGTVILSAGQPGHDGFKAGATGCTYTFATTGNDTVVTISAGSLIQIVPAERNHGGAYSLSWSGTALGKLGTGAFAVSPVLATGVLAAVSLSVEWGVGTLGFTQLENALKPTVYDRKDKDMHQFDCEYFYQTSYVGVSPGAPGAGAVQGRLTFLAAPTAAYAQIQIFFTRAMYGIPAVVIYNPSTGAMNSMRNETVGTDFGVALIGSSSASLRHYSVQASTAPPASATMSCHFTASSPP